MSRKSVGHNAVRYRADQLPETPASELAALAAIERPDTSDLPESVRAAGEGRMELISFRVDRETLRFFRGQGEGYQTRMRRVLQEHVRRQLRRESEGAKNAARRSKQPSANRSG